MGKLKDHLELKASCNVGETPAWWGWSSIGPLECWSVGFHSCSDTLVVNSPHLPIYSTGGCSTIYSVGWFGVF